jgi:uncharacterized protein with LGFP repeats
MGNEHWAQQDVHNHQVIRVLAHQMEAGRLAIDQKYAALGGAPGAPTSEVQAGSGEGWGFYRTYEKGAIYWRQDLGAWNIYGAIFDKYLALGGETSKLGYPTSDETSTADGVGRFNHFEHGSISFHPTIGAFEVRGAIYEKWASLGLESFGYPLTDESRCADGIGRFNHFRTFWPDGRTTDASIYWTADTGAIALIGAIRERWMALGADKSYLGYAVTDERNWLDPETEMPGRLSFFERGGIGWIAETQQIVELPDRVVLNSGHIGVSSVGGWAELILSSAGTFTYRGHLHNSGFIGLYCTVGSVVVINGIETALAVKNSFNVGGTISPDDRDQEWSTPSGYSDLIRDHWNELRTQSGLTTSVKAELGADSFFSLVFFPIIAGLTIFVLASGEPPEGQQCTTSGWHTVKDGNNNTIAEPSGVRCVPAH